MFPTKFFFFQIAMTAENVASICNCGIDSKGLAFFFKEIEVNDKQSFYSQKKNISYHLGSIFLFTKKRMILDYITTTATNCLLVCFLFFRNISCYLMHVQLISLIKLFLLKNYQRKKKSILQGAVTLNCSEIFFALGWISCKCKGIQANVFI